MRQSFKLKLKNWFKKQTFSSYLMHFLNLGLIITGTALVVQIVRKYIIPKKYNVFEKSYLALNQIYEDFEVLKSKQKDNLNTLQNTEYLKGINAFNTALALILNTRMTLAIWIESDLLLRSKENIKKVALLKLQAIDSELKEVNEWFEKGVDFFEKALKTVNQTHINFPFFVNAKNLTSTSQKAVFETKERLLEFSKDLERY